MDMPGGQADETETASLFWEEYGSFCRNNRKHFGGIRVHKYHGIRMKPQLFYLRRTPVDHSPYAPTCQCQLHLRKLGPTNIFSPKLPILF